MESFQQKIGKIQMTPGEEGGLWRQRFFEVQVGTERYLTEAYGRDEIATWLPVKSEILRDLDTIDPRTQDVRFWKERFFRTQARLEKYVAEHHGLEDLERWTAAIAQVFRHTEPSRGGGAMDLAVRFAKQAHCYESDYEIPVAGISLARVVLNRCAIWDYRELARSRGVQLTLESPCTYCTKATAANARAQGFRASFTLHNDERGHGCTWDIEQISIGAK